MRRVLPLAYVGVCGSGIDKLVLDNHILPVVVHQVLHIQDLGVRVVVHPCNGGVLRIGHIDNMHLAPSGDVCVGVPIRGLRDLNLGVTRGSQLIE